MPYTQQENVMTILVIIELQAEIDWKKKRNTHKGRQPSMLHERLSNNKNCQ